MHVLEAWLSMSQTLCLPDATYCAHHYVDSTPSLQGLPDQVTTAGVCLHVAKAHLWLAVC